MTPSSFLSVLFAGIATGGILMASILVSPINDALHEVSASLDENTRVMKDDLVQLPVLKPRRVE